MILPVTKISIWRHVSQMKRISSKQYNPDTMLDNTDCLIGIFEINNALKWCPGPDLNRHAVTSEGF